MLLLGALAFYDPLVLPRLLVSMGLISIIYCLYYLRSERSFNVVHSVFF